MRDNQDKFICSPHLNPLPQGERRCGKILRQIVENYKVKFSDKRVLVAALFSSVFLLIAVVNCLPLEGADHCKISLDKSDSYGTAPDESGNYNFLWGANYFTEALNEEGLEVRDSDNRVVKSNSARLALKELFINSVFCQLADESLPILSSARKFFEERFTPFAERFNRMCERFFEKVERAVLTRMEYRLTFFCNTARFLTSFEMTRLKTSFLSLITNHLPLIVPLRC